MQLNNNSEITITPTLWGKLFGKIQEIRITDNQLIIINKKGSTKEYSLNQIFSFPKLTQSLFGSKISFEYLSNDVLLTKLSKDKSTSFFETLEQFAVNNIKQWSQNTINVFSKLAETQYLRDSNIPELNTVLSDTVSFYQSNIPKFKEKFDVSFTKKLDYIASKHPINEANAGKIRSYYERDMLQKRKDFFDIIESNPLTEQQRLSVIRNNDINMVLAAAGTGKTSVMVAKALDLIESNNVNSDEILILAFNRDAANELSERLDKRAEAAKLALSSKPSISTFHALGRRILKECGKPVHLSKFAEDPVKLDLWFQEWLKKYIEESNSNLARFIYLAYQPIDPFQFETKGEYDRYVCDNEYRTLNGERVRGYQELLIANWFFLKSVPYQYEARYVSKKRIEIGFDYKPDFDLGNGIYLEHFGIDRNGNTRPDIDAKKYNENMIRKRELHKTYGTTLLETYHYNWKEKQLSARLKTLMDEQGIPLKPKTTEEVLRALNESGIFNENKNRYLKCLQAIRSERLDRVQVLQRLQEARVENAQEYTDFLMKMHDDYIAELRSVNEIDFDDMILEATKLVQSGAFKPQWKHMLVDEFQDISMARLELLQAIYTKGPRPIWTVVGDDWQSIYRFAGGKLEVTTRFGQMIGSHTLSKLEKTYRYNNSIADTAGRFIMQNPEQYKKNVVTHTKVSTPCVHLYDSFVKVTDDKGNTKEDTRINLKTLEIYKEIREKHPNASIAVLARYRYLLEDVKKVIKDKKVKFWTFHGSKGLEADYCILVGFFQGKTGFPNQNKEEAVVEALLPMLDNYSHSEERRLLYVALTRSKKESYLVADANAPSEFINELLSPQYNLNIVSERFKAKYRSIFKCPVCSTGYFVLRAGQFGHFYSCTSGSVCPSSPRICEKCGSPSVDTDTKSICQNPNCRHDFPICEKCGRPMRLRDGKFGQFWGCSGYGIKGDQCTNTRKYFI